MGLLAEVVVSQAVEGGDSQGKRRAWSVAGPRSEAMRLEDQARDPPQGSRVWVWVRPGSCGGPCGSRLQPRGSPEVGHRGAGLDGASLG